MAPDTGSTTLAYDARDNMTSYTDPVSVTTQFIHNGFGDIIQEISPDRGTSTYVYDEAGRLTQQTDGRGQAVTYSYDWLGRITGKTPTGLPGEAVTYTWDTGGLSSSYAIGRLAKVVDASGTTKFQYDHRGNLLAQEQTIGTSAAAQIGYTYDLADRVTQIAYPSGRLVRYGYDSKGRVTTVETKASSSVGSWTLLASGFAYDANGNIAAITDAVTPANSALHGYDSMDRLNLIVADAVTGTASYGYTPGTNRLASVTDASGTRAVAYDGRGNMATETRSGSVSVATAYDGYGRLTGYTRTATPALTFAYNGLDDRVAMTAGIDMRRFAYLPDGRVLGEYGASASDVKAEFIWASPTAASDAMWGGGDGVDGYAPLAVARYGWAESVGDFGATSINARRKPLTLGQDERHGNSPSMFPVFAGTPML